MEIGETSPGNCTKCIEMEHLYDICVQKKNEPTPPENERLLHLKITCLKRKNFYVPADSSREFSGDYMFLSEVIT